MSINFFDALSYNNQNKTISQKIAESVDEYFYLGNKSRQVKIFNPDRNHPKKWARQIFQNSDRSWMNIALKITSYCTLILPLIGLTLKATLRSYLQISSIPLEKGLSQIETKLPDEILMHMVSFLPYKDQSSFAQGSYSTQKTVYNLHQYYREVMAPLKEKITKLPPGPLAPEDSQQLLIELIRSPAIGHPKFWTPVMDALRKHITFEESSNSIIQSYAAIAILLAESSQPISLNQFYKFCEYLGLKFQPWIGYRILEQYLLQLGIDSEKAEKILEEYLNQQAEKKIQVDSYTFLLDDNRELRFKEIDIDPRKWFGSNASNYSLWLPQNPGNETTNETTTIPTPVLKALWTRIQSLRRTCRDYPCMIALFGREEAELPHNFTLPLAQLITDEHIFLDHNFTINPNRLQQQSKKYARSIGFLEGNEVEELAQAYPAAFQLS